MADVKWIKIVTDIFDDEKILLIESLPDGDSIIVCWFKLLCLAGKQNNSGVLMMNERVAYTEEMLATVFRRPLQTVRLALETFEQFGMVEIINGAITIPNWGKHQNLEDIERVREKTRERVSRFRERQKMLISGNVTDTLQVTQCNAIDKELDIEEELDRELEKDSKTISNEMVCRTDVQRVIDAWNSLGLGQVRKIVQGTQREQLLKKRIKDYGVEEVLRAVENVRNSTFLNGNNSKGWIITFDWFIKPNNFPKVLDGNYAKNSKSKLDETYSMMERWANSDES